MPENAHVTSVAAIEEFRAHLVVFVSKARPTLEEVHSDVVRLRAWLEQEQRRTLESLVHRRQKALEQAQSSLSTARMSVLRGECTSEQMAVRQARRALEEAESKLKRLKLWTREFDNRVEPLAKLGTYRGVRHRRGLPGHGGADGRHPDIAGYRNGVLRRPAVPAPAHPGNPRCRRVPARR